MAKKSGMTLGIILILVGLLGFVPGGLGLVGATGYFLTGMGLELGYIILGIILIFMAQGSVSGAATGLKFVGIIYVLLAIVGFVSLPILGFVNANGADNWLHLVLGIVIFLFGYYGGKSMAAAAAPATPAM